MKKTVFAVIVIFTILLWSCGTIPEALQASEPSSAAPSVRAAGARPLNLELANGDYFKNAALKKVIESIESLDDDNFFFILSDDSGFLQAMFSDGLYYTEYQEQDRQYAASELLSKEEIIELATKYYNGEPGWNVGFTWEIQ